MVCYDTVRIMAYQVTKRVGNRAYRYEVTTHRDPQSGRRKTVWTYLGRDPQTGEAAGPARSTVRDAVLDALTALLSESGYEGITVDALARRAAISKATFYRHFKDKREAFFALFERTGDRLNPASVFRLEGDADAERAKICEQVRRIATHPPIRNGLARAFVEMQFKDPEIARRWEEFAGFRERLWRDYIESVNRRGIGYGDDPATLAQVLSILAEGVRQLVALRGSTLDDRVVKQLGTVFARIVIK
jgi:AcrR family transcriptional regulator